MVFPIGRRQYALVLTCEHGGNRVPSEYRPLFLGRAAALRSHRGWDPGALDVARSLARLFDAPLVACTVSRLVVDANRSEHHARVLSEATRSLSPAEREQLLERHYRPHRARVIETVGEAVATHGAAMHVAVHSFTPVLDGDVRTMDVGLLYDPAREPERALAGAWRLTLGQVAPQWKVRRNAPYRGVEDGLTKALRRRYPATRYVGIELELNQRRIRGRGAARDAAGLVARSLRLLADGGGE